MITKEDILFLHQIAIKEFGGSKELRDEKLLESAISRPFQTFEGKELYPSPAEKASALLESIIINHPFVDGNKRTGYLGYRLLLLNSDKDIKATQSEKYDLVMKIASGEARYLDIFEWTKSHLISKTK